MNWMIKKLFICC